MDISRHGFKRRGKREARGAPPGTEAAAEHVERTHAQVAEQHGFVRAVGLFSATTINMTQMVGIGPFVTIPIMVGIFGGAQALLGWVIGAVLALADGLVWAELGSSLPGAGGTYIYLREAFQKDSGKLLPFLFVWSAMLSIPLIMSTGIIGVVQYLSFLPPFAAFAPVNGSPTLAAHVASIVLTVAIIAVLWRGIRSIAKITEALWVVMLAAVAVLIAASLTHFDAGQAFDFGSFSFNGKFLLGLGGGLLIGVYDYLGYNTASYMAEEIKNPGRVLPKAIVISILAIMGVYLVMNIGVLGVLPAGKVAASSSVASSVLQVTWGTTAAYVVTVMIVVAGLASVFTGLLGASRIPFNAALDRVFFHPFGRLHSRLRFPILGLLWVGAVCALGTLFTLTEAISIALAVLVIIQAIAQIAALIALRVQRPDMPRPYRMWLYPLPAIVALVLWGYVWVASGLPGNALGNSAWLPIYGSLGWLAAGVLAFLVWARANRIWPFGAKEIHEFAASAKEGQAA